MLVFAKVEGHTKEPETLCSAPANRGRALPYSSGETDGIEAVHGGSHRSDRAAEPVEVNAQSKHCSLVTSCLCFEYLAHVWRSCETEEPRPVLEGRGQLGRRHTHVLF